MPDDTSVPSNPDDTIVEVLTTSTEPQHTSSECTEDDFGDESQFISKISESFKVQVESPSPEPTDTIPLDQAKKILSSWRQKVQCPLNVLLAGLAKLAQDGGTNKNKTKLIRKVGGYTFD